MPELGFEGGQPFGQRFVFGTGLGGHGLHGLEFLAGDELHVGNEALDKLTDDAIRLLPDPLKGTQRAGGKTGEIIEETVFGLHDPQFAPPAEAKQAAARRLDTKEMAVENRPRRSAEPHMSTTLLAAIAFPAIDPVALQIGPLAIRWYALAYVAGIVLGWRLAMRLAARPGSPVRPQEVDDLVVWLTLGIVLGGRIGYVLFYNFHIYVEHPLAALRIWEGGMSFHGGLIGVILAVVLFARNRGIPLLALGDIVAAVVPIGLFFGRVANFINGELWGRPSDMPWAMIFPHDPEQVLRHPSQLYQAGLEGILLFVLVMVLNARGIRRHMGALTGAFLMGYGLARITGEFFREPDAQLGFLAFGTTMGQILSLPMVLIGLWLLATAKHRPAPDRSQPAA